MYGLADISLFESVTNCKCAIFNDTYSDVVEDSDPLASRPKRIKELSKKNPVKKGKQEVIEDITQKIEGKKEEQDKDNAGGGVGECLDTALSSLRKIESHLKKISAGEDGEEKGRAFAKKYGKKIKQVYGCANRALSYVKKMDLPKHKMVIVIKQGTLPGASLGDVFAPPMAFADQIGADLTRHMNDIFSF